MEYRKRNIVPKGQIDRAFNQSIGNKDFLLQTKFLIDTLKTLKKHQQSFEKKSIEKCAVTSQAFARFINDTLSKLVIQNKSLNNKNILKVSLTEEVIKQRIITALMESYPDGVQKKANGKEVPVAELCDQINTNELEQIYINKMSVLMNRYYQDLDGQIPLNAKSALNEIKLLEQKNEGGNSTQKQQNRKCNNFDNIRLMEQSDQSLKFDNQCLITSYEKFRDGKYSPKSATGRTRADTGLTKESSTDGELLQRAFISPQQIKLKNQGFSGQLIRKWSHLPTYNNVISSNCSADKNFRSDTSQDIQQRRYAKVSNNKLNLYKLPMDRIVSQGSIEFQSQSTRNSKAQLSKQFTSKELAIPFDNKVDIYSNDNDDLRVTLVSSHQQFTKSKTNLISIANEMDMLSSMNDIDHSCKQSRKPQSSSRQREESLENQTITNKRLLQSVLQRTETTHQIKNEDTLTVFEYKTQAIQEQNLIKNGQLIELQ